MIEDDDDAPKLTQEWADGADVYDGDKLLRRGRNAGTQDFSHYPTSVTEARADKTHDSNDWTPRDALISLLRQIDSGETRVDVCVVAYRMVHDDGSHSAAYVNASAEVDVALGVLARVASSMARE